MPMTQDQINEQIERFSRRGDEWLSDLCYTICGEKALGRWLQATDHQTLQDVLNQIKFGLDEYRRGRDAGSTSIELAIILTAGAVIKYLMDAWKSENANGSLTDFLNRLPLALPASHR